ncbi:MAG: phosphatase PAP2/dual specificity phosphatase family protein [Pseudomonadota bacterium]
MISIANDSNVRPWKRALGWLAFLGPFFFLTYGLTNTWTSRLSDVESIVFDWEKHIPFLAWTILPYMSIDAFYALSLFICKTSTELDTHGKRLLSATLISIAGFLLFPLKFSFDRPATEGFNGMLFDVLTGFDKPFNQAPSLHISLLMLLWVKYARHMRGKLAWFLHCWFALIGLSVFTTYQHHVIDGVTGIIVGVVCFYLFPDLPVSTREKVVSHVRCKRSSMLQLYYLIASGICFAFAFSIKGWAWLMLWPGISFLLVSLAYAYFGVRIFQKHEGKLSWSAYALLWPYHTAAWFSSRCFTRHIDPCVEVVPGVWIGRIPSHADLEHGKPQAVLDLTAEFHSSPTVRSLHYRSVPMMDLIMPSLVQLREAVDCLDALYSYPPVLVHCALGYSRSALVIASWLLHRKLADTPENAIAMIRNARPQIVLSSFSLAVLDTFYHEHIKRV